MVAARRVVVTQRDFDDETLAYLQANNCDVRIADLPTAAADRHFSHDQLVSLLAEADGWIVGHALVTRDLLAALPRLKVISRRGVGFDRVDVTAARELGRVVAIAVGGNDAAVADQTIGMMIAVGRRLRETQANMAAGDWTILLGSDLWRKTVGIIGLGRIGKGVVQRLRGFEAQILVMTLDPDAAYAREAGIRYVDLATLLRESDYVTLHAPLTTETRHVINSQTLDLMKSSAILVNAARGGLVNDADLLQALREGRIAGAALDVYVSESDPTSKSVTEQLISMPNVVATPHSAGSTRDSLRLTNMIAARSVVAVLDGGSPAPALVVADGRTR